MEVVALKKIILNVVQIVSYLFCFVTSHFWHHISLISLLVSMQNIFKNRFCVFLGVGVCFVLFLVCVQKYIQSYCV